MCVSFSGVCAFHSCVCESVCVRARANRYVCTYTLICAIDTYILHPQVYVCANIYCTYPGCMYVQISIAHIRVYVRM